jgi:MFS family permease
VPAGGRLALVHPQVDAVPQLSAATRRRDLGLLLSGAAVSTVGSSLALLAVMVHLEPAGPGWIAAAWGAELLPVVLLAPVVGRIVDRVRNRELLLGAIGLQGVALLLCGLLGVQAPGEGGAVIVGSLVLLGVGTALANPVVAALLPRVSGEEHATRAYGWFSMISQAGFLAGFAVAGVLVDATSERTALLVAAGTTVVMAVAVAFVRTQRLPGPGRAHEAESVRLGFARVRADRVLLVGVAGLGVATLISVLVNVADVFYVLDVIGASPSASAGSSAGRRTRRSGSASTRWCARGPTTPRAAACSAPSAACCRRGTSSAWRRGPASSRSSGRARAWRGRARPRSWSAP